MPSESDQEGENQDREEISSDRGEGELLSKE